MTLSLIVTVKKKSRDDLPWTQKVKIWLDFFSSWSMSIVELNLVQSIVEFAGPTRSGGRAFRQSKKISPLSTSQNENPHFPPVKKKNVEFKLSKMFWCVFCVIDCCICCTFVKQKIHKHTILKQKIHTRLQIMKLNKQKKNIRQ